MSKQVKQENSKNPRNSLVQHHSEARIQRIETLQTAMQMYWANRKISRELQFSLRNNNGEEWHM